MFSSDALPSPPSGEQRLRIQIETEAAEAEVLAERMAPDQDRASRTGR